MVQAGRLGAIAVLCACGPVVGGGDGTGTGSQTGDEVGPDSSISITTVSTTATSTVTVTTVDPDDSEDSDNPPHFDDFGIPDQGDGGCNDCDDLDVLFVIDNSRGMAPAQLDVARAATRMIAAIEALAFSASDVQIMVTTTDMGNPLCTPFQPAGYEPARGAPTTTGCNARIDDFTSLAGEPTPWACTDICPTDVVPADPFVWIAPIEGLDNVGVMPADIDGDGIAESGAAQALACLIPQGTDGCGYEATLESMLQALNPASDWNEGDRPFLRSDARLAIVLVSDESDCSVEDYSVMEDESFFATSPDTGLPAPSSALCWNAGITCDGPDGQGVYSDCAPMDGPLQEVDRYRDYLVNELVGNQGKQIAMLVLGGVPRVVEYDSSPPYAPTAGGLFDLVYRNWQDGEYPAGDILPAQWAEGTDAADKQFELGIGPGCTYDDPASDRDIQAVPSPRAFKVCSALDQADQLRCCVDSICDPDPQEALTCAIAAVAPPAILD